MKNILVTGATGFIGHEVANQLAEQGYRPKLKVIHVPEWLALTAAGALDTVLRYKKSPNRFSKDAVKSWNLEIPVVSNTLADVLKLDPKYPTITEGIPAVLCGSLSFSWCPSNLDR